MKLLFVTPYFPPSAGSGVQRGAKFVKYLLRLGWEIEVVTIDPSAYPERDESLANEVEGARVVGVAPVRMPGVSHLVLRSIPGMRRAISASMKGFRPDVVLTTTPDYHWVVVAEEAARRRVPFVLDYPDPWTVLPDDFRTFAQPSKVRSKMKWAVSPGVEKQLLDRAAFATFATEPIQREYVLARYLSAHKAEILENGFDEEDFEGAEGGLPKDRIRLTHVGSFAGKRTPLAAAGAVAAAARQRPDLKFELRLVGAGSEPFVDAMGRTLGSDAVEMVGWIPHADAVREMLSASVLWLDAMAGLRSASTGKIYEYLRSGRPILGVAHPQSPATRLVRAFDAGVMLDREDHEAAGTALIELGTTLTKPRDPEELSYYSREALASRLSQLLMRVKE